MNRETQFDGDLPEGWVGTIIDSIGRWSTGGTPSRRIDSYFGGNIPWIKSGDLNDGRIIATAESISEEGLNNSSAKILPKGTLSIALYGATIGKLGVLEIEAATNQACANCQIDTGLVERWYVFYYLLQQRQQFIDAGQGGAQPNLTNSIVRGWPFPLPPLAEQKRIVAKVEELLARVNAARERLTKIPALLKRFRQSILAAACSGQLTAEWREENINVEPASERKARLLRNRERVWNQRPSGSRKYRPPYEVVNDLPMTIPVTWCWVTVSHLGFQDVGFAFKSAEFVDSGIRLLRGENVEPGSLRWTDTRYWPKKHLKDIEYLLVNEGEIILAMDRPVISTGLKIARAKQSDLPCLLVQRVMRFCLLEKETESYLFRRLQHSDFADFLTHDGMTGSDLPHITGTGVAEFPVPLPPLAEQREIIRRVDALFALADKIEARVVSATVRVEKITQAILAKAFRGELVPTEAELARQEGCDYETAEQLLTRIQTCSTANETALKQPRTRRKSSGNGSPNRKSKSRV